SILDLAERIRVMSSSRSVIEFVPYEKAYEAGFEDMPRRVPDLTKIGKYIGYRPTVGLEEILRRVIEHTRATLELEMRTTPSADAR
ncbi:MAG TPA: hypothetical protein VF424_07015, partial [Vicinamibacterales bacterium]